MKKLLIVILLFASCTRDSESESRQHMLNDIFIMSYGIDVMPSRPVRDTLYPKMLSKVDSLRREAQINCDKAKNKLIKAQATYIKLLEDSLCKTDTL